MIRSLQQTTGDVVVVATVDTFQPYGTHPGIRRQDVRERRTRDRSARQGQRTARAAGGEGPPRAGWRSATTSSSSSPTAIRGRSAARTWRRSSRRDATGPGLLAGVHPDHRTNRAGTQRHPAGRSAHRSGDAVNANGSRVRWRLGSSSCSSSCSVIGRIGVDAGADAGAGRGAAGAAASDRSAGFGGSGRRIRRRRVRRGRRVRRRLRRVWRRPQRRWWRRRRLVVRRIVNGDRDSR